MWSLPSATTLFPMPPVSWLSIWVRGQDNMKTEPQWWISSSCPSLSWSGRRDQWDSRSPGDDCFDDWQWSFWQWSFWRWSFWWLTLISVYSAPGWSSHFSSQKDLQSFLVGPAWSPYGLLGPQGRTSKLNQCFYHRAIFFMVQELFSPTILFLVWWHVCTSRIPLLPPCMCTPPCQTLHIFFVLIHSLTNLLRDKVQTQILHDIQTRKCV